MLSFVALFHSQVFQVSGKEQILWYLFQFFLIVPPYGFLIKLLMMQYFGYLMIDTIKCNHGRLSSPQTVLMVR